MEVFGTHITTSKNPATWRFEGSKNLFLCSWKYFFKVCFKWILLPQKHVAANSQRRPSISSTIQGDLVLSMIKVILTKLILIKLILTKLILTKLILTKLILTKHMLTRYSRSTCRMECGIEKTSSCLPWFVCTLIQEHLREKEIFKKYIKGTWPDCQTQGRYAGGGTEVFKRNQRLIISCPCKARGRFLAS